MPNLNISAAQACSIQQSQDHDITQHDAESENATEKLQQHSHLILAALHNRPSRISEAQNLNMIFAERAWEWQRMIQLRAWRKTETRYLFNNPRQQHRGVGNANEDVDDIFWMEMNSWGGLGGKMERGVSLCWARTPTLDRVSGSDFSSMMRILGSAT